eukprot:gene12774-17126_t
MLPLLTTSKLNKNKQTGLLKYFSKNDTANNTVVDIFSSSTTKKRLASDAIVLDFVPVQKQKNPVGRPVKNIKIADIVIAAPPLANTIMPSVIMLDDNDDGEVIEEMMAANSNNTTVVGTAPPTISEYSIWSDSMKSLLKFYSHKYGKDGSHIGWNTAEEELFKIIETQREEPETLTSLGLSFKFPEELYPKLIDRCIKFKNHPGFGIRVIKAMASKTYRERFANVVVEEDWTPSDSWCYWFMKNKMNLRIRIITDTLALDVMEGVRPDMIIGSDEFGQHFFPVNKRTWETNGAKHVESTIWDDKRQYTGNIIHNASGELLTLQLIFGGKSQRSLPTISPEIQKDWIVSYSKNHWSNLKEKKALIDWIAKWRDERVDELIRKREIPASCRKNLPMVILLDCWSVNTSKEFKDWIKETYPYMKVRYIPAGLTGKFQINDTYFHGPYKQWVREA